MGGEQSSVFDRAEVRAIGRIVLVIFLYAISGFLLLLTLGAAMSEPGTPAPTSETLIRDALALFAGASIFAWSAGVLWIGPVLDGLWPSPKGVSSIAFVVLATVLATPVVLVHTIGETKTLSDLQLVTWGGSPPCLLTALLRAFRGRQFGRVGTIAKRALIVVVAVAVVAVIGYCALIVAANMGIDTSLR